MDEQEKLTIVSKQNLQDFSEYVKKYIEKTKESVEDSIAAMLEDDIDLAWGDTNIKELDLSSLDSFVHYEFFDYGVYLPVILYDLGDYSWYKDTFNWEDYEGELRLAVLTKPASSYDLFTYEDYYDNLRDVFCRDGNGQDVLGTVDAELGYYFRETCDPTASDFYAYVDERIKQFHIYLKVYDFTSAPQEVLDDYSSGYEINIDRSRYMEASTIDGYCLLPLTDIQHLAIIEYADYYNFDDAIAVKDIFTLREDRAIDWLKPTSFFFAQTLWQYSRALYHTTRNLNLENAAFDTVEDSSEPNGIGKRYMVYCSNNGYKLYIQKITASSADIGASRLQDLVENYEFNLTEYTFTGLDGYSNVGSPYMPYECFFGLLHIIYIDESNNQYIVNTDGSILYI